MLVAVAATAAVAGGVAALAIGKAAGWTGDGGARTVLVPVAGGASASSRPAAASTSAARPLAGNSFDPAEIYRARAGGVVTIYALFGSTAATGGGSASQGSGFVVS